MDIFSEVADFLNAYIFYQEFSKYHRISERMNHCRVTSFDIKTMSSFVWRVKQLKTY